MMSRRPSLSDEVVAKVEKILREDRRITTENLALHVSEICHEIVTKKLGFTKVGVPR